MNLPVTLGGGKIFTIAISSSSSIGTEKFSGQTNVGGMTSKINGNKESIVKISSKKYPSDEVHFVLHQNY